MVGTEGQALGVAHEAKTLATKAVTMVESLAPQIQELSRGIADMRRENGDQHRENGRIMSDGLEKLHSRISSVKSTIDTNRSTTAGEIKALDDKLTARMAEGDKVVDIKISKHLSVWQKHKDKLLWLALVVAASLLADKLGIKIPEI